jgi:hypothetical protein
MAGRKHNGMTAKQPQDTRGKGFNPEHSQPDNCERPSATTATTDSPELTAAEAATTLASQTLEDAANSLVARSYRRHQVVGQMQTLSSQLALQDAAEDYFVLSGAHYENEYRRNLAALASAEQAFQQEFNFQRYLDRAIEQRAKLPSASRTISDLNLLPES